jgi:hypothetical protein
MTEADSVGQREIRALARRLQAHATELPVEPTTAFDLRMASELLEHLAKLTTKLSRPVEVELGSSRRP